MRWFASAHPQRVNVYTDGSIRPEAGASGLAAVVRGMDGQVLYLWHRRAGKMTCNEAEYAAVTLALEYLRSVKPQAVHIYSDSQVVVQQMQGLAAVRAPALRQAHLRLRALVNEYERVEFHHIPREQNRLADALANETVDEQA